jgi:Domain of unknown function (DUF1707)
MMAAGYNVRVGDAEREATAAQLREHFADGRLTLDELNERLDQTFAAKTRTDLNTVMVDLPYSASAGPFGTSAYPGQAVPGPMATRRNWDDGYGGRQGHRGSFASFAPLMGLVWVFVILGAVSLFGLGGGDRPIAIVLFIAALALFRRIFGLGRGRRTGGPRGRRGPRGPRR